MEQIVLYTLETFKNAGTDEAYLITGEPCGELLALQKAGYCVLAEFTKLKGLSEKEIAEALAEEDAVMQYEHVCISSDELSQAYLRRIWARHQKKPVLIAETERLIIRESIPEDAEAFWRLYRDRDCLAYLEPILPETEQMEAYRKYIEAYQAGQYGFYEYGMWSVVEKTGGKCIGRVGLEQVRAETKRLKQEDAGKEQSTLQEYETGLSLGYALLPEYRGRGYAVEACKAVLDYCRECEYAEEVYVQIQKENTASLHIYEKLHQISPIPLRLNILHEKIS